MRLSQVKKKTILALSPPLSPLPTPYSPIPCPSSLALSLALALERRWPRSECVRTLVVEVGGQHVLDLGLPASASHVLSTDLNDQSNHTLRPRPPTLKGQKKLFFF